MNVGGWLSRFHTIYDIVSLGGLVFNRMQNYERLVSTEIEEKSRTVTAVIPVTLILQVRCLLVYK